MGIRDRLRKQRQLERERERKMNQQTVPEAIEKEKELEQKVEKVVEKVVEEVVEELVEPTPEPMPVVEPQEEPTPEPMPVIEPKEKKEKELEVVEMVVEVKEEKSSNNELNLGTYKISGIYKEGLVLSFNNFEIRPTSSALIYGNGMRIKGANNPFAILINQEYSLKIIVDPHLLTVQIGKTILREKMNGKIQVTSNQPITIE